MKERFLSIFIVLILVSNLSFIYDDDSFSIITDDIQTHNHSDSNKLNSNVPSLLNNAPRAFTANHGQLVNDEVVFYDQGGSVWFGADGVFFEVRDELSVISRQSTVHSPESRLMTDDWRLTTGPIPNEYKRVILKQEFVGANDMRPVGRERLSWNSNFFYGNDSTNWRGNVPNYAEVWFENIYNGIDLRYYTKNNALKYDIIVHPGGNPDVIKIKYKGAQDIRIDNLGNVIINTQLGNIKDSGLFIYQDQPDRKNIIDGNFKLYSDFEYGYEILENYDTTIPLIIDPELRLNYSTYIGGNSSDGVYGGINTDSFGNVYLTGQASSWDFPTTPNAISTSHIGSSDVFILKLNHNGSDLLYSTYLGGGDADYGLTMEVDSRNNMFVSGDTYSSDFPVTSQAFDATFNGSEIFVLKLAANGSTLMYSTYLGGDSVEHCGDLAIDSLGQAYITGETYSDDFPITPGAYDTKHGGYNLWSDCFLTKINQNGTKLLYSTFIGGMSNDYGVDIKLDSRNNAYITGHTFSSNFPTTNGSFDTTYNGNWDGFVLGFDFNQSNLTFSTFLGGTQNDGGFQLEMDNNTDIYVAGYTFSTDFPNTTGAYDRTYNSFYDVFITKFDHNCTILKFSTYFGGENNDMIYGFQLDSKNNVVIAGQTQSFGFPTTDNALNDTIIGDSDAFITILNSTGSDLLYSTYFGGSDVDVCRCLKVDKRGDIYIAGYTWSLDFPTTNGSFRSNMSGLHDLFVTKFLARPYIQINSVSLLMNKTPVNKIYSRLADYTFRVNITDTESLSDLHLVRLTFDPSVANIAVIFDRFTNKFFKFNDPVNLIELKSSSISYNNSKDLWTVEFDVEFNWTWPNDGFIDIQVFASSNILKPSWMNITNFFTIETDLEFMGELHVWDEYINLVQNNDLVRGGGILNFQNLIPVYEGTTDVFPPDSEIDISVWDDNGKIWLDSPEPGNPLNIDIITPKRTLEVFNYTINLSGIPSVADMTHKTFMIRTDADNISFSDPWPANDSWQKSSEVYTGITITDHGGAIVDNSTIMHSISTDNGTTWSDWTLTNHSGSADNITVHDFVVLDDGDDNLIKWRGQDILRNGPVDSIPNRILVDTTPIFFKSPTPMQEEISITEHVQVGITILDITSGVNASTIKYSYSTNAGHSWSSWKTINGYENGKFINPSIELELKNGTGNRIRWRASDLAGNGPTESDIYSITVNTWQPPKEEPKIILRSPVNNSIIPSKTVSLSWSIETTELVGITYDIYLDTQNPPVKRIEKDEIKNNIVIQDLGNGKTYYWTVIPKRDKTTGTCLSGVWQFQVRIPLPRADLVSPVNNSIIPMSIPTLVWSLDYTGSEIVRYNLYFGTDSNPPIILHMFTTTHFLLDFALEDNTTYYWRVEPYLRDLDIPGNTSSIWSFSVDIPPETKPEFALDLILDPNQLELAPGEAKIVKANITNLGINQDTFSIQFNHPSNSSVSLKILKYSNRTIMPENASVILFAVIAAKDTETKFENWTVTAASLRARAHGQAIISEKTLNISIIAELDGTLINDTKPTEPTDQPDGWYDQGYYNLWLLIIIIAMIVTLLIFVFIKSKKIISK